MKPDLDDLVETIIEAAEMNTYCHHDVYRDEDGVYDCKTYTVEDRGRNEIHLALEEWTEELIKRIKQGGMK